MKRFISATIAFALSVSCLVPVFAADSFKDVNSKSYSWAYEYVEDMAERGLIKGYEDGTFRPGNSVSRMDAFALFSRLMGSNSDINADTLAQAKEKYADVLEKYNLSYAEGDIAFMLSRGVITENELDTYFAGSKKTEAMPRHEAAILITKAMLGEKDAKNEVLLDMDYNDVSSIPKASKQYVYYVTKAGIMSGMGDGAFSPNTDVLRGQIAVMLSKTVDSTAYQFEGATLSEIDEAAKNIDFKDADGKDVKISYEDDTRFFKGGEPVAAAQLSGGQKAILTYVSKNGETKLAFADVVVGSVDSTKSVIFKNYTSSGGTLIITVTDPLDDSVQSYTLSASADITGDGKKLGVNDLKQGDYITVGLSGDVVVEISAMRMSTKFDATIEKVNTVGGTITLSSDVAEFDGITLPVLSSAKVYKNGDTSGFSSLGRGDKAKITLEYGIIKEINATSATKTITGVLKSYTVSDSPSLTINRDGTDYTFDIPASADITLNGEKVTLAAFNIGSSVSVTVESEVVKKLSASEAGGNMAGMQVTGTVVGVYDKTINILNTENGGDVVITVYCANAAKILSIPQFTEYELKKIKAGDTIIAYGAYANGIFVASGITVTPATAQ